MQFRFDAEQHEYIDIATGQVLPHITGMLKDTGWIDDTWFTEESSARGQAVHRLSADYDHGALHVDSCVSIWRPWLLTYIKAIEILRPRILSIEVPRVHWGWRFGGRPDRVAQVDGAVTILEVKTGDEQDSHPIQTAIQAMLVAPDFHLPPFSIRRYCVYVRENGKFKVQPNNNRHDLDEARKVIAECTRRVLAV
jgi:PD-(D/E)XK nuclease superfamily